MAFVTPVVELAGMKNSSVGPPGGITVMTNHTMRTPP